MQNRHKTQIKVVLTLMTPEIAEAFGYRDRILGIDAEARHDTIDRLPRGSRGQRLRRAGAAPTLARTHTSPLAAGSDARRFGAHYSRVSVALARIMGDDHGKLIGQAKSYAGQRNSWGSLRRTRDTRRIS
jgi:hypothetical protein